MTQVSRFWDGTTVGDATAAPYDAATEFARVMQSVSGAGGVATNQSAVFRGELNELAVTGAATPVSINTGRAMVAGTWYENDAAATVAIPTPAALTRIDRIVLRKDWSAAVQTVRITRIAGAEGGAAPPLVQIWGTTWDEPLAQVSIDIAGVITLTDQRQFVGGGPLVNIASFAVGDLLYANTTTTLARLADVATGSVLVSGGVSVAPAWSASPTVTSLTTTGNVIVGGVVSAALGAIGAPSYSFTGDLNTGMWSPGADVLAWSTGGAEQVRLTSTGLGIGRTATYKLDVSGAIVRFTLAANQNYKFSGNNTLASGISLQALNDAENANVAWEVRAAGVLIQVAPGLFVGGSTVSNSFNSMGITIQQGANDNEILSMKSTYVAHGMTSITEADTYSYIKKGGATGGVTFAGLSPASIAVAIVADATTAYTGKTTGNYGAIQLDSNLKSGTGAGAMGATDNLLVISNAGTTRFIFQADGASYEDVGTAWVNFDDHNDITLLTDLAIAASRADDAIHQRFASFLRYSPEMLQAMDLIHFNADGHHFANRSKIQMALIGASRQLGDRTTSIEQRVEELERENGVLRNALVGASII